MVDPECARGGGVSHNLAEKGLLASLYSKKCNIFTKKGGGGGRTPGTPYAGYATEHLQNLILNTHFIPNN